MKTDKKVLIIDDDPRNIFALTAILKAKGYSPVSANSAIKGIQLLKEDATIAIVLMDMMMPEMDGYEAINAILNIPEISSTPVVAVTAQAMQGDKEKCLNAGAVAYISKPIDIDELISVINQY